MTRTMLDRYKEKNFGKYDRFMDRLDAALPGGKGTCTYCLATITTDPLECSWNVCRAHFHHDAGDNIVALCRRCHKQIHWED